MLLNIVFFTIGLALLYYGAEFLVRGSANVATILGVKPIVVGLTVVALGTSLPELVASLIAVFRGASDIALGNVIGSNIANVGLVMGIGALFYPLLILPTTRNKELPFMVGFTILLMVLCANGSLSRWDGAILFTGVIAFTGYYTIAVMRAKSPATHAVEGEVMELTGEKHNIPYELGVTLIGIIGVVIGAYLMVESAVVIARAVGVSELVIGITIVAVGTSLPELATTVVASIRKHSDIAVGNIIGSNIYNIGLVLGGAALAKPLTVTWKTLTGEIVVMAIFSLALIPLSLRLKIGRIAGASLLAGYMVFILWVAKLF